MVKGTKRKIEIKKIENRFSMATSFTKRSRGLYSKASELCLLAGAQIAVLATPSSSKSNVSFYSFGHSSVDSVVSAFLSRQNLPPVPQESKETREDLGICMARRDLGLGFWWDDDERFKSREDIMEAIESMKTLLSDVRTLRSDLHQNPNQKEEAFLEKKKKKKKESDVVSHHDGTADQTLIVDHNLPNLDDWSDMDYDQLLKDFDDDFPDEEEPIMSFSDNTCNSNNNGLLSPAAGNLEEDMGLDFEAIFEGLYSDEENEFAESLLMI